MKQTSNLWQRLSTVLTAAGIFLIGNLALAQTPSHLFRQRPSATPPGRNATVAHAGEVDENLLSTGPQRMTIALPGKPDLLFERKHHQRRGPRRVVWRGRAENDPTSEVTLTLRDGILLGRIQSGKEVYNIRPGANGRTIVEKLDPDSFAPEWGHDSATHGHERVPPPTASEGDSDSSSITTAPTTAAAGATTDIALMSVVLEQPRLAAPKGMLAQPALGFVQYPIAHRDPNVLVL